MSIARGETVLRVQGLSKSYRVYPRPLDLLLETMTGRSRHSEFMALEDISFEIRRGEVVGLIGSNGAGKSTLLKIIAGTLDSSAGRVEVSGRISAILELGTAFNPEYSGRENVRLALVYAGLAGQPLERRMAEAIEFSELDSVIDRPFKTYSSGMQARLTFSAAMATRSELMIIDEALAAGDAHFVSKCIRFMDDICREENVSALLVSHAMGTLMKLCDRGIYLRKGRVVLDGPIREVVSEYEKTILTQDEELLHARRTPAHDGRTAARTPFRITGTSIASGGEPASILHVGENASIVVHYESEQDIPDPWIGIEIYSNLEGAFVTTLANDSCRYGDLRHAERIRTDLARGTGWIAFEMDPLLLGAGSYFFHFSLFSTQSVREGRMNYGDALLHQRYVGQFRVKQREKMFFETTRLVEHPLRVLASAAGHEQR